VLALSALGTFPGESSSFMLEGMMLGKNLYLFSGMPFCDDISACSLMKAVHYMYVLP